MVEILSTFLSFLKRFHWTFQLIGFLFPILSHSASFHEKYIHFLLQLSSTFFLNCPKGLLFTLIGKSYIWVIFNGKIYDFCSKYINLKVLHHLYLFHLKGPDFSASFHFPNFDQTLHVGTCYEIPIMTETNTDHCVCMA